MTKRIDLSTWTCTSVTGRVYEVWQSPSGDVVVLGSPKTRDGEDDESHNCDANGCGQDHVLWRGSVKGGGR